MAAAAELFIEYLERRESGEELELDAFCAAHPSEAAELRVLARTLAQIDSKLQRSGAHLSLRERTESVPIAAAPEAEESAPGAAMDVLERLGARTSSAVRYQRGEEVARGGQGVVLRVWDQDLRRTLAMKVMRERLGVPGRAAGASRSLARFLEEAQVTGQLDHPCIVPVHELGLDDAGRLYFTMRLVKGRELREILRLVSSGAEGWNQTRALSTILKVCEAMAYAHAKGVIHRDLKPANVMVGRFGEVYVMDWGLACVLGREDLHDLRLDKEDSAAARVDGERLGEAESSATRLHTMDGDIIGTPAYMSPEQASCEPDRLGPWTDVYAIGAMLYELLTGSPPYLSGGQRGDPHTVVRQLQVGPPRPIHELAPTVSPELSAICEKAMAREPEQRYKDMLLLAEDLRAYLENRVVSAYEAGAAAELKKWVLRNRALATSVACALALALLGLAAVGYVQAAGKRAAEADKQELLRLSDGQRLSDCEREAEALWPTLPTQVEGMQAWLTKADALTRNLPLHRATLQTLRTQALAPDGASDTAKPRFTDTETQWQHDTLAGLVSGLEAFVDSDPQRGLIANVRRRLDVASQIERRTLLEPRAAWESAGAAIAGDPRYHGLRLRPQLGLVPLGPDPGSGLWEFAHLLSGSAPVRDGRGKLVLTLECGLVFVLLPGATFTMGAQATDPGAANYDRLAKEDESPPHAITLPAFFLSKYELTQAQYERVTGHNPSLHHPPSGGWNEGPISGLHPVEQVSWDDCREFFRKLALAFPSEAEWEYATRAGSNTAWPTGSNPESLQGFANLADSFAGAQEAPWTPVETWLADGWVTHAPVGTYAPNAFGLHEMTGNIWEWCRDIHGRYGASAPGAEERGDAEKRLRVVRGSGFDELAQFARSASRLGYTPDSRYYALGVRPARALDPTPDAR